MKAIQSFTRVLRKSKTLALMLAAGDIRDTVMLLNRRLGLKYLDFSKETVEDLGLESSTANGHQTSGFELDLVLGNLTLTSKDAIIDLGSGKGGALLVMAHYPFGKILGVELSSELATIAKRNIARLGRKRRIEVVCEDASKYEFLDDFNYVYLFNPFPDPVMIRVLENLKLSLQKRPRDLTIIYANPKCEDAFREGGFFKKTDEYFFENKDSTVIYAYRKDGNDVERPVRTRAYRHDGRVVAAH